MRCVNSQMLFVEINQYAKTGPIKLNNLINFKKNNKLIAPREFRLKYLRLTKREISSVIFRGIYTVLLMAKSTGPIALNALD